jgi:type II secretory pathway pseudopilin PulG
MSKFRITSRKCRNSQRQSGFSLWETVVVVGVISLGVLAGTLLLNSSEASVRETARVKLLRAVDNAIVSFIAENGRLPCPASAIGGAESCDGAVKGWLPVQSLGLDASAPVRGVLQMRYVTYKNSNENLIALSDKFQPTGWEKYAEPSAGDPLMDSSDKNMVDFCQSLKNILLDPTKLEDSKYAHAKYSGGTQNVAYAIVDGGSDKDSDGNIFDGSTNLNIAINGVESPLKEADSSYDDKVFIKGFADLSTHLSCPQIMRSLDALAQAVEVSNEVKEQQTDNADSIATSVSVEKSKAIIAAANLANAVITTVAAAAAMSVASAGLASSTALCAAIITAPVGCPLVAVFSSSLSFAIAGVVASAAAIVANTVTLTLQIITAVKTKALAAKAAAAISSTPTSLDEMLQDLKAAYLQAETDASNDRNAATNARTEANSAQTTYTNSVNALYGIATNANDPSDTIKPLIDDMVQKYKDYQAALQISRTDEGSANAANQISGGTSTGVDKAKAAWDKALTISPATNANIISTTKGWSDTAAQLEATKKALSDAAPDDSAKKQAYMDARFAALDAASEAREAAQSPSTYIAAKEKAYLAAKADYEKQKVALKQSVDDANAKAAASKAVSDAAFNTYNTSKNSARTAYASKTSWFLGFAVFDNYSKSVEDSYVNLQNKLSTATRAEKTADDSAANAISMKKSYDDLKSTNLTPGTDNSTAIGIAAGADAILKKADAKGAVK